MIHAGIMILLRWKIMGDFRMSKKDFDDFKFAGSKKMALIKFHGDLLFCDPGWTMEYKKWRNYENYSKIHKVRHRNKKKGFS